MSDQWGQPPQQGGYSQQPYRQGQQPTGYYGQPQQPPSPYAQQQFAPLPPLPPGPGRSSKRPIIISLVALAVLGGAAGIYFATQSSGSGGTVKVASTSGMSPTVTAPTAAASATGTQASPTSTATRASPLSTEGDSNLLTTHQVCPAFLEIEQPLINQMGDIDDEAQGLTVFESFAPKFEALAASTPSGQYQTEIRAVADDLDAIVAALKANPHMSKPAPPAFDDQLNTLQNDIDTVDNNCDPLGSTS